MNYVYVTQVCCQNLDCNVREIEIVTKDLGDYPEPAVWNCPGCGQEAQLYWRRDLDTHRDEELADAICVVNAALYQRDQDTAFVPASILLLDALPDSWKWEKRRSSEEATR